MPITILKSHIGKQILGACTGMAIAALLYVGLQEVSLMNMKGILVSTSTVSENAGQVRVNSKNIDDASLRLIAYRARTVSRELEASKNEVGKPTALEENVSARRVRREAIAEMRAKREEVTAKTSASAPEVTAELQENTPSSEAYVPAAHAAGAEEPKSLPSSGPMPGLLIAAALLMALGATHTGLRTRIRIALLRVYRGDKNPYTIHTCF